MFPIEDDSLRSHVINDILLVYLRDNTHARELQSDGTYQRLQPSKSAPPLDAQSWLTAQAVGDVIDLSVSLSALPSKYRKYLTSYGRVDPHE
jgi:polyphosphate kinase